MTQTNASLPPHPGSVLLTTLDHLDCTRTAAAHFLRLSRQTIDEITGEKQAITPSVALRIAKITGTRAEMWLELQQAHDLALARAKSRNLLEHVPQLEERW